MEVLTFRVDLYVRSVVQLLPFTEPSAGQMEVKGQESQRGNGEASNNKAEMKGWMPCNMKLA
jgi:hypothetical protein